MPPQHVEIAETIAALKRALKREREPPTNQAISAATNRGHKLARGANRVHAGAIPYPHGQEGRKQKIEHACYTRYILQRNPRRYNGYGEELEDSESDAEADEDAEDENPYAGIRLEELLCPLKHPSQLAAHPTLSLPFLDPALPDMVRSTEEKLRQERANLWRAKNLSRQFMGDESWIPLENTEGADDWDMFEPKPKMPAEQASKRHKRDSQDEITQSGVNGHDYADATKEQSATNSTIAFPELQSDTTEEAPAKKWNEAGAPTKIATDQSAIEDVNEEPPSISNGVHDHRDLTVSNDEPKKGSGVEDFRAEAEDEATKDVAAEEHNEEQEDASEDEAPQPTRRITRALAAEHISSTAATPPRSPNSTPFSIDSYLLQPDPLFLLPPVLAADHRRPRSLLGLGIPFDELMETRRLLMMYIQKQEESVRGYEAVLGKLIKAKRMRDRVWEWCKTEGHVGELSDGEDWIDAEAWGLVPEELKKGTDEDNNEAQEDTGRKGKRRRRD